MTAPTMVADRPPAPCASCGTTAGLFRWRRTDDTVHCGRCQQAHWTLQEEQHHARHPDTATQEDQEVEVQVDLFDLVD